MARYLHLLLLLVFQVIEGFVCTRGAQRGCRPSPAGATASPCRPRYFFSADPRRGPADDDWLSAFVKRFLPTPEDVGLTRYDRTTQPERYPCTKDEFAALLGSDKKGSDAALLRQLLAKTNLETRELTLAYDANRDGWDAKAFHKKVDKKGPAVVLCRSVDGGVFGGYNPTGWVNYGEYRGSIAAFLYVFPNGDVTQRPVKLAKISGAGLAQIDDGQGPRFGSEGLTVLLERSRPKQVRCKLGLYYERLPDGGKSFLPGGAAEAVLNELKVFVGVYAPGEKVPYDDAMPFSLN